MQTVERQSASVGRPSDKSMASAKAMVGQVEQGSNSVSTQDFSEQRFRHTGVRERSLPQENYAGTVWAPNQNWLLNSSVALMPVPVYEGAKRVADFALAMIALFVLAPVGLFIALLIWAEDQGPIFYWQERVGQDGKRFRFYKFRSMVTDADKVRQQLEKQNEATGPIFKMKNDPRITRVGRVLRKYSLDELPQFFNVLRGEMSLVGPRPHLPKEVAQYQPGQERRLDVRPGLVCLREVCGRSRLTFEEWVALDLMYVKHRNMVLDLWILLRLVPAVLSADGAY